MYTSPFSTQRKQVGIILLSKKITAISLERQARHLNTKDLIKDIRDIGY